MKPVGDTSLDICAYGTGAVLWVVFGGWALPAILMSHEELIRFGETVKELADAQQAYVAQMEADRCASR